MAFVPDTFCHSDTFFYPPFSIRGPFGAKEIGEGSTLPVLGAVAHAIANATGVWITDLPITPEKIVRALKEKEAQVVNC